MTNAHDATVRSARIDDDDEVRRLTDLSDVIHREGAPWLFKVPDASRRSDGDFEALLSRDDAAVFVAVADGGIVGVAFAELRSAPDLPAFHRQRWCVLDGLVVDPTWRRRGVGRLLTQRVESWANEVGAPWVELNVYEFNVEARRFYEDLGYLPFSTKLRKPRRDGS